LRNKTGLHESAVTTAQHGQECRKTSLHRRQQKSLFNTAIQQRARCVQCVSGV